MAYGQGFTWFSNQEDQDEDQFQSPSAWQPSESTSGLKRSHNADSMDGPIHQDVKTNKPTQFIKYTLLSLEEVQEKSAQYLKQDESGTFCCLICYSYHNNPSALESHLASPEHIRRITVVSDEDYMFSQPHCCKTCAVICSSAERLQAHLTGKKHTKNVELSKKMETKQGVPVSREALRSLLHVDIKQEGSAYQIGITNSMKDFYTMDGPLIGLQYAVEIDDKGSGIQYHCSICQVTLPEPNKGLHFTSYNHITSVLKKDYPERYKNIKQYENKKKDLHALLKSAAQEIEMAEGRKVAFIHRRIIEKPLTPSTSKGKGESSKQKKWRKSKHVSVGHGGDKTKSKGGQRDTSHVSRSWRHISTPYPQHASMVQWAHHRPQLENNALYRKDPPPFHEMGITPHPNMDCTYLPLYCLGGTSTTYPPQPNMDTIQPPYPNTSTVHPPLANIAHPNNNVGHHPLPNIGTTQPPYPNISVSHPPPGNMDTIHPPPANVGTIGFPTPNMDTICLPPAREIAIYPPHSNMSTICPPTVNMDRTHHPFNMDLNATCPPPHNTHGAHPPPLQRHQTQSTKDNVLEELTQAFNSSNNGQERQPLFSSLVRSERDADLALKLSSVLTQALVSYHIKNINSTLTGPDGHIIENVKELMKDFNEQGHSSQN